MDRQDLVTEMRGLRERVPGVTGALVAALDGRLMAADLDPVAGPRVDPESVASIAAASLGVARQVAGLAGQGRLGQAVTRASRGHVSVYAIDDVALVAVLGDDAVDVADLHRKAQPALDRIHAILARPKAGA
jgi:predicted regulator of Ras-like GTPase activity (Roadblock/LC7/MglB family)